MVIEQPGQILENKEQLSKGEIQKRLEQFHKEIQSKEEFRFISDLKKINPEAGVYFVGGAVRDVISGKEPEDIDLVVNNIDSADLIEILSQYGKLRFSRGYEEDPSKKSTAEQEDLMKNSFGIVRFKPEGYGKGEHIDIGYPRQDDHSQSGKSGIWGTKRDVHTKVDPDMEIGKDLERRDLTMNAMAINLSTGELIDEFDGLEDLLNKRIKMVGNAKERIEKQDMSRAFRAMRFTTELDGELDNDIKDSINNISRPAEKSVEDVFTDEEQLKKAKIYEKEIRRLFKIPARQNMPVFLQTVWDENKDKPQTATSRNDIENEVKKALKSNPVEFLKVLNETEIFKVLLPEVGELNARDIKALEDKIRNLKDGVSFDLKLAALFYDLGNVRFKDIKLISLRFNFLKNISRNLVRLVGRTNKFFTELNSLGDEDLNDMFLKDKKVGRKLIRLINLNLNKLDIANQEKAKRLLTRVKKEMQNKNEVKGITGGDITKMGYRSGPDIRKAMNELKAMQRKGKKIGPDDIKKVAKKLNLK